MSKVTKEYVDHEIMGLYMRFRNLLRYFRLHEDRCTSKIKREDEDCGSDPLASESYVRNHKQNLKDELMKFDSKIMSQVGLAKKDLRLLLDYLDLEIKDEPAKRIVVKKKNEK